MPERQHRLDQPGDPSRGLQMTQIGLDDADQQRRGLRTSTTQHRPKRTGFDGIATQIDGLYLRDEKRELEYLSTREQIRRLEARIA